MPIRRLHESIALAQTNAFGAFCGALGSFVDGEIGEEEYTRVIGAVVAELHLRRLPPERLLSGMVALNCRPLRLERGDNSSPRARRYARALHLMLEAFHAA